MWRYVNECCTKKQKQKTYSCHEQGTRWRRQKMSHMLQRQNMINTANSMVSEQYCLYKMHVNISVLYLFLSAQTFQIGHTYQSLFCSLLWAPRTTQLQHHIFLWLYTNEKHERYRSPATVTGKHLFFFRKLSVSFMSNAYHQLFSFFTVKRLQGFQSHCKTSRTQTDNEVKVCQQFTHQTIQGFFSTTSSCPGYLHNLHEFHSLEIIMRHYYWQSQIVRCYLQNQEMWSAVTLWPQDPHNLYCSSIDFKSAECIS